MDMTVKRRHGRAEFSLRQVFPFLEGFAVVLTGHSPDGKGMEEPLPQGKVLKEMEAGRNAHRDFLGALPGGFEEKDLSSLLYEKLVYAWGISEKWNSNWAREECAQIIGRYFELMDDFNNAIVWYQTAYSISLETRNIDRHIENSILLAKLYLKTENIEGAHDLACAAKEQLIELIENSDLPRGHQFYEFLKAANFIIQETGDNC